MEMDLNSTRFFIPQSQDIKDHLEKHSQQSEKGHIRTEVWSREVWESLIIFFSSN